MTDKGAFTKQAAADYLSVSTRYLDQLVLRGELAKTKAGRKTLFRRSELDQWLDRNEIKRRG